MREVSRGDGKNALWSVLGYWVGTYRFQVLHLYGCSNLIVSRLRSERASRCQELERSQPQGTSLVYIRLKIS